MNKLEIYPNQQSQMICILGFWWNSLMISLSHWQLENLIEPTWVCTTICLVSVLYNGGILAGIFTRPCLPTTLLPPRKKEEDSIYRCRWYPELTEETFWKKKIFFCCCKWILLSSACSNLSPWCVTHDRCSSQGLHRAATHVALSCLCWDLLVHSLAVVLGRES